MIKCREGGLSFLYCTGPVSALGSIVIINDNPDKFVQGSEKFFIGWARKFGHVADHALQISRVKVNRTADTSRFV